ncbi:hypothetical protein CsSME_00010585 [Camellia sinensis var. sinensis]
MLNENHIAVTLTSKRLRFYPVCQGPKDNPQLFLSLSLESGEIEQLGERPLPLIIIINQGIGQSLKILLYVFGEV